MINRRIKHAATFAVAAPVLAATMLVSHGGSAHAATAATTPERSVIATATARDLKIDVTAERAGSGAPPTATVRVEAFAKTANGWQPRGELRLGGRDAWFWDVLNGPHAVREFTISNETPDRGSVQLLVTPALGWSPTYHFQLEHGTLVR